MPRRFMAFSHQYIVQCTIPSDGCIWKMKIHLMPVQKLKGADAKSPPKSGFLASAFFVFTKEIPSLFALNVCH